MSDEQTNLDAIVGEPSPDPTEEEIQSFEAPDQPEAELDAVGTEDEASTVVKLPEVGEEKSPREPGDPNAVPLATHLELKNEYKELRRQVEELQKPKQPDPEPEPGEPEFAPTVAYEEDPAEFLKQQNDHILALREYDRKQLDSTDQTLKAQQGAQQQRNAMSQVTAVINDAEVKFTETTPDYSDAAQFMRQVKSEELRAMYGPEAKQGQIDGMVDQQMLRFAVGVMRQNQNPAEALYKIAKASGYSTRTKAGDAKLDRIEKGQQNTRSAASIPGGAAQADPEDSGDFLADAQRAAGYRR